MKNQKNFNVVIGITGLKAGGKDELSRVLREYGYNVRRVSDAVRDECAKRGIDNPSIEQLMEVGNWGREHSGDNGYWAGRLLEMLSMDGNPHVAINGIRNPGEIETLRRLAGPAFVLVGITAPTWIRYKRAMKRKQGGDHDELEGFLRMDDRDRGIGEPPEGQQVDRCLAQVDPTNLFFNSGTMEEYERWIAGFVQRQPNNKS
jgi:dephospho-CoA kinase